jgi:hypothetical protein
LGVGWWVLGLPSGISGPQHLIPTTQRPTACCNKFALVRFVAAWVDGPSRGAPIIRRSLDRMPGGKFEGLVSRWNKDAIALEILRLYTANEPLSYGEVQKTNLRLLRAATRYFGTWKTAVEYAGLDYERIRRYKVWTSDRIVEQIQAYYHQGKDLAWRHVSTVLDPPLAAAAIRTNRFGSWREALRAAGLDYDEIRRHRAWDDAQILDELRRLQEIGASLRVSDAGEHSPSLVAAARRRFGGWYEAIVAAGLDEMQARRGLGDEWDEETGEGEVSWSAVRAER